MPSVFVSIANYRDPEIGHTIQSIIENTTDSVDLKICVLSQCLPEERPDLPSPPSGRKIEILQKFVEPKNSRGACWARAEIQREYRNEDYYLQLDSHIQLTHGWNDIILKNYIQAAVKRPAIITAYLPPYQFADGERIITRKVPLHFKVIQRGWLPNGMGTVGFPHPKPCKAYFFSGHFSFSHGRFIEDVPYDPELFFMGEEISMALRSYCYGYDLFTPTHFVGAHLYRHHAKGSTPRPLYWHPADDAGRPKSAEELDLASKIKVGAICRGELHGRFGIRDQERYEEIRDLLRKRFDVDLSAVDPMKAGPGAIGAC